MPKKTKYRKSFRGRRKGNSKGGNVVAFGDFGIQAVETSYVTARQIEAARMMQSPRSACNRELMRSSLSFTF